MIRKATINEVSVINEIYLDAKALFKSVGSTQWLDTDGYPNQVSITNDIKRDELYVKEVNGIVTAVASLTREEETAYNKIYEGNWLNNDKYYTIHRIAVKKEYYGKGYAKELMQYLENETIKDGIFNIKIDTMENNTRMIKLLESIGYVRCGVIYLLRPNVLEKKRIGFQKVLKDN